MRRELTTVLLLSLLVLVVFYWSVAFHLSILGPADLWLHTCGVYVCDANGAHVILNGVNVGLGDGSGYSSSDISYLKSLGFNSFRIFVYWGLLQPYNSTPAGVDQAYFTSSKLPNGRGYVNVNTGLDGIVNDAVANGMYVELTMEWERWYPPPTWAFVGDSNNTQRYESLINGTAGNEVTGLVNSWEAVAARYANVPNVIFEIPLNEPIVSHFALVGTAYSNFNTRIISGIESVEARSHLKMIQFLLDSKYNTILSDGGFTSVDVAKSNVIWTSHHYSPTDSFPLPGKGWVKLPFTWNGQVIMAGWQNDTVYAASFLIYCANLTRSWGRPWVITEFGKYTSQANWNVWLSTILSVQAQYNCAGWYYQIFIHGGTAESTWNLADTNTKNLVMPYLTPYMNLPTSTSEAQGGGGFWVEQKPTVDGLLCKDEDCSHHGSR